jgi:hypothetical protein
LFLSLTTQRVAHLSRSLRKVGFEELSLGLLIDAPPALRDARTPIRLSSGRSGAGL